MNRSLIARSSLEAGRTAPPTYYESLLALAVLKLLPVSRARRLAGTAGLRNRIVHQYESVDLKILHKGLRVIVREYTAIARAVRARAGQIVRKAEDVAPGDLLHTRAVEAHIRSRVEGADPIHP